MKLAIGINIFKSNPRQDRCIETLNRLAIKNVNLIELYNITFEDEVNTEIGFIHLPKLKRKGKDIIKNSNSNKPISKDFFDILCEQDCDYFLFLNSDILLSQKAISLISKGEYETYCFSRHDIYPLQDLTNKLIPIKIEIAGFDAWCIKKDWWIKNRDLFDDYIYAEALWDVFYTLQMFNNSNCFYSNKEFYIAHENHEQMWNESSVEYKHNFNLWNHSPYVKNWNNYLAYLVKRQPFARFLYPLSDEYEKEQKYLKICH